MGPLMRDIRLELEADSYSRGISASTQTHFVLFSDTLVNSHASLLLHETLFPSLILISHVNTAVYVPDDSGNKTN